MATKVYERNITCIPLAAETGSDTSYFRPANVNRKAKLPVQLSAVAQNGDYPTVEELKGEATAASQRPVFGFLTGMSANGTLVTITIVTDGMNVARYPETGGAVRGDDIGKGIRSATTDGNDGGVSSGAVPNVRATIERGVIVGGNTATGTATNPAYFRVIFNTSG